MTFRIHCPQCGLRLRVSDEKVGKVGRCPHCNTAIPLVRPEPADETSISVPAETAPSEAAESLADAISPPAQETGERWHLQSHDGNEYGPISQAELDGWVMEGVVSNQCKLKREGEDDWKPATESYPDLPTPGGKEEKT